MAMKFCWMAIDLRIDIAITGCCENTKKDVFLYDTIKSQQKSFAQLPAYREYLVNKFPGAYCQLLHEEHGDHRFK